MPKLKKILSAFLALWLCVMLVTFTYTWVSRNWTPSINSENMSIATAGALVISLTGDESYTEVSLNDIIGLETSDAFVFRQVSSQDGMNFFWKDFSPTLKEQPAVFYKIDSSDSHKKDYIDTKFCLKLDDSLKGAKYVFIHPETMIECVEEPADGLYASNAMRISLSYEKEVTTAAGTETIKETVILGNLEDNEGVVNADNANTSSLYTGVLNTANGKNELDATAVGHQTVYGLEYFNCGRSFFDPTLKGEDQSANYNFIKDPSKALFKIEPGELVWVEMRIWLEGQDENCVKEIAGDKFDMVLKFDSVMVES